MTLRQKQSKFCSMVGMLICHANFLGYELTFGRAYVNEAANKAMGSKLKNSLHTQKLAVDLNLFLNGVYLSSTESHEPLGLYWESIGGTWGGRFNDGNHYSLEHNGVK